MAGAGNHYDTPQCAVDPTPGGLVPNRHRIVFKGAVHKSEEAVAVVHGTAKASGRITVEDAVDQTGAAPDIIDGPTATRLTATHGGVSPEYAVSQNRITLVVKHPAATQVGTVILEYAADNARTA